MAKKIGRDLVDVTINDDGASLHYADDTGYLLIFTCPVCFEMVGASQKPYDIESCRCREWTLDILATGKPINAIK